jgi:hypothetical protein
MIIFSKLKYFNSEKYYEKLKIFRTKFESIWSLGTLPNDLFTPYFILCC